MAVPETNNSPFVSSLMNMLRGVDSFLNTPIRPPGTRKMPDIEGHARGIASSMGAPSIGPPAGSVPAEDLLRPIPIARGPDPLNVPAETLRAPHNPAVPAAVQQTGRTSAYDGQPPLNPATIAAQADRDASQQLLPQQPAVPAALLWPQQADRDASQQLLPLLPQGGAMQTTGVRGMRPDAWQASINPRAYWDVNAMRFKADRIAEHGQPSVFDQIPPTTPEQLRERAGQMLPGYQAPAAANIRAHTAAMFPSVDTSAIPSADRYTSGEIGGTAGMPGGRGTGFGARLPNPYLLDGMNDDMEMIGGRSYQRAPALGESHVGEDPLEIAKAARQNQMNAVERGLAMTETLGGLRPGSLSPTQGERMRAPLSFGVSRPHSQMRAASKAAAEAFNDPNGRHAQVVAERDAEEQRRRNLVTMRAQNELAQRQGLAPERANLISMLQNPDLAGMGPQLQYQLDPGMAMFGAEQTNRAADRELERERIQMERDVFGNPLTWIGRGVPEDIVREYMPGPQGGQPQGTGVSPSNVPPGIAAPQQLPSDSPSLQRQIQGLSPEQQNMAKGKANVDAGVYEPVYAKAYLDSLLAGVDLFPGAWDNLRSAVGGPPGSPNANGRAERAQAEKSILIRYAPENVVNQYLDDRYRGYGSAFYDFWGSALPDGAAALPSVHPMAQQP